ncbi:MAG TPA: CaiB/BaiF CoA-transferase family protein, partial [Kofleriaceae bacterium]|nr:CaiB/BaiF CoA-transferase family protein [Kofleriaceae bacterium]
VVKIEDPRLGDYLRHLGPPRGRFSGRFNAVNRDKRSVALDLKAGPGREAFLRLVARADVVIESFRPGVLDKLGVGYQAMVAANPRIIVASISGYGQSGPYRERAGHDLNYIALAGVLAMGGDRGGRPQMPGIQIADLAGGGLWGATGVIAALFGRERTGEGAHLDISMTEGALALLAPEIGNLDAGGKPPTRGEETLNGGLACYSVYRTKDDRYVSVGALEPKFWLAFNAAIGRKGDIGEVAMPAEKQEALRAEIQAILAQKTRDEWAAIFAEHDCCCEAVLEVAELAAHPLHRERGVMFRNGTGDDAPLCVKTPVGAARASRGAPDLGEHTAEVLAEYGFSASEIAALTGG